MAKRTATSELNHDNWDAEEETETPGTFTPLSGSELKNRIIKKAKRSLGTKEGVSGTSPFAAFSGFTVSRSSSSPFSFLNKNAFGDDGNNSSSVTSKSDEKKENGSSVTNEEKKTIESESEGTKKSTDASDKQKPLRSIEYYRHLQSLNESVMNWMQFHLSKNACCDFTPVFNDYKKHLDTLNVTYPVKGKESDPAEKKVFFKKPASEQSSVRKANNVNSAMRAGDDNNNKTEEETDYGAHFSSNTTNTSTFSFGIKSTPTSTSSSFSGPTTSLRKESVPEKKNFQFSFGLKSAQGQEDSSTNKPFSFVSNPIDKSAESEAKTEDSEYVPPKNEFIAVKEEDAFYSKRCKLFFKKDDGYVERGIGALHLKPCDGKTQLLIRADTSLGNILLNIMLSSSLPMSRTGKNNVLIVCVPNPPVDSKQDSKEAIPMLIRVKTSEDADELLETLNKHNS